MEIPYFDSIFFSFLGLGVAQSQAKCSSNLFVQFRFNIFATTTTTTTTTTTAWHETRDQRKARLPALRPRISLEMDARQASADAHRRAKLCLRNLLEEVFSAAILRPTHQECSPRSRTATSSSSRHQDSGATTAATTSVTNKRTLELSRRFPFLKNETFPIKLNVFWRLPRSNG